MAKKKQIDSEPHDAHVFAYYAHWNERERAEIRALLDRLYRTNPLLKALHHDPR